MSRRNRQNPSPRGDLNAPTTERIAQPPAEPNALIQETTMEASAEPAQVPTEEKIEQSSGPTAKEMALAEEVNAARRKAQIEREQAMAEAAAQEPIPLVSLAAKGREALMEGLRQHATHKPPEYVPPPRTARQMAQLEAELAAGRRSQQRHAEQLAARPAPERDVNEGFTTPVHRPADMVPDPMTGRLGPISQ